MGDVSESAIRAASREPPWGKARSITRKGSQRELGAPAYSTSARAWFSITLQPHMQAHGRFPDCPADFLDMPPFVACICIMMSPAIQVIFNPRPQLQELAAALFPGVGVDSGGHGGLAMYWVVDIAAILAGCTICESATDINPFLACPQADKLGRILHVYESLKAEPPDGVTSLSLIQAFAAAASALGSSDPLQEDLLLTSADFLSLER